MKKWFELSLRSFGQVMFQNNLLAGLFFLIGIFWAAISANEMSVAWGALVGGLVANLTALPLKADRQNIQQGLYGYNGILIGIAVMIFFNASPLVWGLLVLGSIASAWMTLILLEKFKATLKIPALTFPFVLITWIIFFIILKTDPSILNSSHHPPVISTTNFELYLHRFLNSFSQVFLLQNSTTGSLFIFALLLGSFASMGLALFGVLLALGAAIIFGVDFHSLDTGLCGYNSALTAIALGSVFFKPSLTSAAYAFVGVGLTIVIHSLLSFLLATVGLPVLTAPFIFSTWIVLFCSQMWTKRSARLSSLS